MMKAKTLQILTVVLVMFTASQACASARQAVPATPEEVEEEVALSVTDEPKFGHDSVTCVRNWSLYDQYYKQQNFRLAIDPWRWMLHNCPLATQNIYIHGAVLSKYMYTEETDPVVRESLVDTLMMVYDQRINYFGREGFVQGRKAADLYTMRPNAVQEQYEYSERSIELDGNNAQADVLLINFQSAVRLVEAGLMDAGVVVEKYDRAMDIIEDNLKNKPQETAAYIPSRNNIELLFEPYASCENLVRIFKPRFEANPKDPELLDKITDMLEKSGCTDDQLFFNATRNLHALQPNAQSAFLMGRMETTNNNFTEALKYYEQAIKLYEEDDSNNYSEEIFRTYLLMADISYRQLRRLTQARTYALAANQAKPDDGRPFLLIGDMYAASASDCGDDEFTRLTAYWAAVDKFIQARNANNDPAVVELATQRINTFSQYFPNIEQIFFHGYDRGQSYRVQCWINETTRIRARGD